MRLLVTGTKGQVVTSLRERGALLGHEIIALGRPELDLAIPEQVTSVLQSAAVDVVVSAAAYTAVDRAESEPDMAFAVNAEGPRALALAARDMGVPLIHISTDYVFDGTKTTPYLETDPTAPLGVYGSSKLAGERAIDEVYGGNSAILRTAWVYSPFGANFVRTMLKLAADRDQLRVVNDQWGNPTSALDIADGILAVASRLVEDASPALRGIFHMTATGETTWADFAQQVFEDSRRYGGPHAEVEPIPGSEYPTPAKRPANSRLDCKKLGETHGFSLPEWQGSLDRAVARLLT